MYSVWASSPTDVFVVGSVEGREAGAIFHYDGQTWSRMDTPAVEELRAVWGASPTDVYAVADDVILHYDGPTWTKVNDQGGIDVGGARPQMCTWSGRTGGFCMGRHSIKDVATVADVLG